MPRHRLRAPRRRIAELAGPLGIAIVGRPPGDSPASVATDFAVAHKLDQDGAMAVFYHLKQVGRSPGPPRRPTRRSGG